MEKQTLTRSAKYRALLPMAMMLTIGNQLIASTGGSESITAGEILMYIALIAGVILAAWFLSNGQSKGSSTTNKGANNNGGTSNSHRHYLEHPNDPHFRRLRKRA
jgi:hypothetical protein